MVESACNQLLGKSTHRFMRPWMFTQCLRRVSSALPGCLLALWCGIVHLPQLRMTLLMFRRPWSPFLINVSFFLLSQYREKIWAVGPLKKRQASVLLSPERVQKKRKKKNNLTFSLRADRECHPHCNQDVSCLSTKQKEMEESEFLRQYQNSSMWLCLL